MKTSETSPVYIPIVDTHAHVNLDCFEAELDDLIARSREGRFPEIRGRHFGTDPVARPFISGLICPAVDLATSKRAVALAERYDFLFAAAGVHPNHVGLLQQDEWEGICRLVDTESSKGRLVALGETGLDRHWDDAPFDLQREYFLKTLEQGRKTRLPVIMLTTISTLFFTIFMPTALPIGMSALFILSAVLPLKPNVGLIWAFILGSEDL